MKGIRYIVEKTRAGGVELHTHIVGVKSKVPAVPLLDAIEKSTYGIFSWVNAIPVLAEFGLVDLRRKNLDLVVEENGAGALAIEVRRGTGKVLLRGTIRLPAEHRLTLSIPLDLIQRFKSASEHKQGYTHSMLALALWALEGLKRRKESILVLRSFA